MSRDELISTLRDLMPTLHERYAVASLGLFGSYARGDEDPGSDIDILITFEPGTRYTLFTLAGIKCDLDDALGREVDLVVRHDGLRPSFLKSVERDLIRVA